MPSIRIDTTTKKRFEALAKRARRPKSHLAAEAIATFVEASAGLGRDRSNAL